MSTRVEAAVDAVYGQNHGWQFNMTEAEGVAEAALTAADQIMFSEAAIERAAHEVLNHWRQTSTGRCECGQFASKDPQQIARHLTRAVVAALREEA